MYKPTTLKVVMTFVLSAMLLSANAQNFLRTRIEGAQGKSVSDVRLSASEQFAFVPADAKKAFGLDDKSDLILSRTETDNLGYTHYRFEQTYMGYPVENSMYIVHTKNNLLLGMTGEIILSFDEQMQQKSLSKISADDAIIKAVQYVHADAYMGFEKGRTDKYGDESRMEKNKGNYMGMDTPPLVWYSAGDEINPRDLHLCYKVDVYALQPLSRAYYFVDAQTGDILGKKDLLWYSDATGTCNTAYSGTQTIHSDYTGTNYRLRDYTKGNGVVTLNSTSGHPDYTNSSATWNLTAPNQYALDAHWGVSQTWQYYMTNHNRNSVNNAGQVLTSYVNETATANNAYWDGSIMHFGVRTGGAGITAIDVTAHELTHGVTQYSSNLNYSNQSGAMNESMSDIFGKSVQFWAKPTDVNWLISNDMNWNIRNMQNPNAFSDPDTYLGTYWYTGTSDNGGVHTNSGVGNFMYYLLVTGGSGTNDIGNAYVVTGIGLTDAAKIVYRSNTVYLTSTSQYTNWRTACINAATDLFGAGSNQVTQVMNAWYAVGIGTAGGGSGGCNTPSGLTASSITTTSATLSWSNTGANNYDLQWKLSTSGTWTTVSGLTTTSYTLSGLTACSIYQFQVRGNCTGSSSPYSSASSFTTAGCAVTYCSSNGTNTTYEYINRVALGTINNTSGNNGGYANYTALSTTLSRTSANSITLVAGYASTSYTEYWKVYIDYNHNGVFTDAGENVVSTSGAGTRTGSFSVPASALSGTTRMRVQMSYGGYATSSCGSFTYGEVEDYTVNVPIAFAGDENPVAASQNISSVNIYPNPVQDNLNVEFTGTENSMVNVNVYSVVGQKLVSEIISATSGINLFSINTSTLTKGVYIFEMENNGTITRQKFLVTK